MDRAADGTPNPGFFGANVAAPLLKDIAAALPREAPSAARPARVGAAGRHLLAARRGALPTHPAALCHRRRSAWSLAGAVPPTRPDRIDGSSLRQTIRTDPVTGLRTVSGCGIGQRHDRAARHRALAGAAATLARRSGCPPTSACPTGNPAAPPPARRRPPRCASSASPTAPACARRRASVTCRCNCRFAARRARCTGCSMAVACSRGRAERLLLDEPGEHRLTAMDGEGRHHSVTFTLDPAPDLQRVPARCRAPARAQVDGNTLPAVGHRGR
jgi:penicillin-binding protein 1C